MTTRIPADTDGLVGRYLELLIRQLTGYGLDGPPERDAARDQGADWPSRAVTMVGRVRLRNLVDCVGEVLRREVPGDLMECGVWRGGACILMRAALGLFVDSPHLERRVWVADSFAGLPVGDVARYPQDAGDPHHTFPELAVSEEEVRANFAAYGWLDHRVRFLPGFFAESLPGPVERLALLRLDGDMYGSITDCLVALYPRVSPGGIVIVDDYGAQNNPRRAVLDYLGSEPPGLALTADGNAGWWRKPEADP